MKATITAQILGFSTIFLMILYIIFGNSFLFPEIDLFIDSLLIIIIILMLFLDVLRQKKINIIIYILTIIITLFGYSALIYNNKVHWYEMCEIYFTSRKYQECKESGTKIDEQNVLAVCSREDWNNFNYTESIIYDSSDELALPPLQRSSDWRSAAQQLRYKAPFNLTKFKMTKLKDHFYLIDFYYSSK